MKYTEFTQLMENKGLSTNTRGIGPDTYFVVVNNSGRALAIVDKMTPEIYSTCFENFGSSPRKLRRFIAQACHELAFTDLDDREEEKLYYVKHKWLGQNHFNYLIKNIIKGTFEVTMKGHGENFKDQFTQKEINENTQLVKEIELEIWEQVEVE